MSNNKYLIIGNSKMAKHFSYYLSCLDISYVRWCRSKDSLPRLRKLLASYDISHVIVLLPDRYVERFYLDHLNNNTKIYIHFSGSLTIDGMHGVHPLNTFTNDLYSLEEYKATYFITENDKSSFKQLFPELPNKSHAIDRDLKSYYHALCVISGNFTSIIWDKMFTELERKFNIPRVAAFPYLKKIIDNVMLDSTKALTGPLARKDNITIETNLSSLNGDPFYDIYKSFVKLYEN